MTAGFEGRILDEMTMVYRQDTTKQLVSVRSVLLSFAPILATRLLAMLEQVSRIIPLSGSP